ncbi:GvpL/GvpF family gas vesicle protein [Stenomitos frigidus]|uniref:Gas vesicle protein n=1 Tax=Stenomitos frigidus ULC18 TaxID=2107698 RepID=A0A2T1DUV0_9CYAN|nr:GvpL/GvpF family gas vesicle protein [Stenomitos frigidus]PSB24259.1 gas vesicle protein [Stenomitos frigidus ULC18]
MYTYAFLKTPLTPLTLPKGITAFVQTTNAGQLSAIVEPAVTLEHLPQDDASLVQAVLAHDRVIRSLFLQTTILPLRFGTSFNSLPSLLAHLQAHRQAYLGKLAQLEGQAEYMLKLTPIPFPEVAIASDIRGKDYFIAKKQQYQAQLLYQNQQQEALRQIEQSVAQTYPHHYINESQTGEKTLYLLVARHLDSQLWQQIQSLQQKSPHWELTLGEALPPYHFVSDTVS